MSLNFKSPPHPLQALITYIHLLHVLIFEILIINRLIDLIRKTSLHSKSLFVGPGSFLCKLQKTTNQSFFLSLLEE